MISTSTISSWPQAFVGKALVMKRFHARARGRGGRILKPFANITIVVREVAAAKA